MTSSPNPPSWAHQVAWERADIFQPATYAPLLSGADYVVHSMGILLEADYKGVVSGQESPLSGLRKAFSADKRRQSPAPPSPTTNPLGRDDDRNRTNDDYPAPQNPNQLTYEMMNRDSALLLARAATTHQQPSPGPGPGPGPSAFLYVSAAGGAPVLPARYIDTKREAEARLASDYPQLRTIFVRAPFLYDASRLFTIPMAAATGVGALFNGLTRGVLGGFLGAAGAKPLKVDVVARAAVEALEEEGTRGPVEVPELEELAEKAWRKGML